MPEFSTQQKRALRKLQTRLPSAVQGKGQAECFLLNYIGFEAQARKVWHFFRCRSGKELAESKQGIPMPELQKALAHFDIAFERTWLSVLLDSKKNKRNMMSARNLRNGLVHQWQEADCKEAIRRYGEFEAIFKSFRSAIGSAI